MFKRFLSFTKGYRILTVICPFMIYLDIIIELEIPKAMGRVVDMLYTLEPGSEASRVMITHRAAVLLQAWASELISEESFSTKHRTSPLKISTSLKYHHLSQE